MINIIIIFGFQILLSIESPLLIIILRNFSLAKFDTNPNKKKY